MRHKIHIYILILFLLISCKNGQDKNHAIEDSFKSAVSQYKHMKGLLSSDKFPKTYEDGQLKTSNSRWWCSGFYPGTLLYLYEHTRDSALLEEADRMLKVLEKEKYNTTTHDLGFMMFCSFGNAYRITGKAEHKEVIYQSAKSLATRFDPTVGCIRSWDPAPWNAKWEYPVIIDNMMNLELLLWAGENFSDTTLTNIAITHANTTLQNHFREDFSSYHVVSYDTLTGEVEKKNTDQGYANESAWARGQAWGLYGFTVMYRFTRDPKYLDQAKGIADFILNHPNLPADKIPYWDFNAPDIPEAKRDASAAAIIASSLLELKDYVSDKNKKRYFNAAQTMIKTLSSPEYIAEKGTNGGFIIKHNVGNMPDGTEVDVPLSYSDYYFVEALHRYVED